jgi:hypothetical protein
MDDAMFVVQIVAMLAALAAVVFAHAAAVETRALRREERIARLLELVADVGEHGTRAARGQAGPNLLTVARLRLRAAVAAAEDPLPACHRVLDVEWPSYTEHTDAVAREAAALDAVAAALEEVAALLVRLRAEGSRVTP